MPKTKGILHVFVFLTAFLSFLFSQQVYATGSSPFQWSTLPNLPNTIGLGGPFAGIHNGAFIVAGGANFPDAPPWQGGSKIWHNKIYVYNTELGQWDTSYSLPYPLAYGGSISSSQGLILIGGSNQENVFDQVLLLHWDQKLQKLSFEELPSLPVASAHLAANLLNDKIFVLGGQKSTDPSDVNNSIWSMDISNAQTDWHWEKAGSFPGAERIKVVSAVQSGGTDKKYIYYFSGQQTTKNADGSFTYVNLTDGYKFDPNPLPNTQTWTPLTPLEKPITAGSAVPYGQSHILTFSGSTGEFFHLPLADRPLFPTQVLAYHTVTDTWTEAGQMPTGVVTTEAVLWQEKVVFPSGEIRPGVRTPGVQLLEISREEASFGLVNIIVLIVYLAILILVGFYFSKREKGTKDFFLAGNRIPWWAAGLSIYATQLSAITFIATPAVAYSTNWLVYPAMISILIFAPVVIYFYLPFFRRLNITTAYEYLEKRFNLVIRLFGSASFIAFQLGRMAIVIFLPALALATVTGINIYACILMMGVLATLYTVLGGMEAVIWTDVIQVIVLMGGIILALILIFTHEGGVGEVMNIAYQDSKLKMVDWSFSFTELVTWSIFLGTLFLQIGPYTTDQAVVQRYLTTKDEKSAAKSIWLNGLISVPFSILFFLLGSALYVFFKNNPDMLQLGMQNDEIFPLFMAEQMPQGISGLVIAGVFAASMSSLDSSMHSISTAITVDFYKRFKPNLPDSHHLKFSRILIVGIGTLAVITAFALATYDIKSLFFFFQKVLGLLGSGLAGIFILGIFTNRTHAMGALIGAIVSTLLLAYIVFFTPIHFYLYAVIGILTCVLVGYISSILIPAKQGSIAGLTIYDRIKRKPTVQ